MTLATRILAILSCASAGGYLVALVGDRGTRSARWFTAVGFFGLTAITVASVWVHPLEDMDTALLVTGVARLLQTWVAVGVVLVVRQRRLLDRGGLR